MRRKVDALDVMGLMLAAMMILAAIVLLLAFAVGWVLNIVAIADSDFWPITGLIALRVIGIFIAPIGAVLGYVG